MEEEWTEYDGGAVQNWHRNASRIRVASGVAVIPGNAFEGCQNLRAVDLSNVTAISDFAFMNCTSLEKIIWTTAPAVEIGESAFYDCRRLEEIDLSNVTKIRVGAFDSCKALTRVTIPPSVVRIEGFAFDGCNNLAEVELGEGIQCIGQRAFGGCKALRRITIPSSVVGIESEAFCNCNSLAEVELKEGLQHISGAFESCTSLLCINIPSTTLRVRQYAFAQCDQLTEVELQEGLQMIGTGAFWRCSSLEYITIPSSVESVARSAFHDCTSLAEVTLCPGVHVIELDAFAGCPSLAHINIPPVVFVIDIERSSCELLRTSKMRPTLERRLVVSKWMQHMSPGQLEQAGAKVNEILGFRQLTEKEKVQCIRNWFAYYKRLDMTTMLELAIWRCNMDGNGRDAEARLASRRNCGNDMNVIILGVLPFLEE